jgi:hypothetical protein
MAAWALVWASVTVVAKQSQLFQPIGGFGAHVKKEALAAKSGAFNNVTAKRRKLFLFMRV